MKHIKLTKQAETIKSVILAVAANDGTPTFKSADNAIIATALALRAVCSELDGDLDEVIKLLNKHLKGSK